MLRYTCESKHNAWTVKIYDIHYSLVLKGVVEIAVLCYSNTVRYMYVHYVSTFVVSAAIAEAVAEWQKLKEEGKLEGGEEEEEEDIYAEARMVDVSVHLLLSCLFSC